MKKKDLTAIAVLVVATLLGGASDAFSSRFILHPLEIEDYMLKDLGVVDFNDDNILDVFTTNCSGRQTLRLGDGAGGFGPNIISEWQLDHDLQFPGLEMSLQKPLIEAPGIYIYYYNQQLYIQAHNVREIAPISGTLITRPVFDVEWNRNFEVTISEVENSRGVIGCMAIFSTSAEGTLVLKGGIKSEAALSFSPNTPLGSIFVGSQGVNPPSSKFTLSLRDRHGMAWADYNGDGLLDVFIVDGGLGGSLTPRAATYKDELMQNVGTSFENAVDLSEITKDCGRGRQVAWVDFNRDGRLDLYLRNDHTPDRLFRQEPDGKFTDVAPALGLDLVDSGMAVWVDVDNNGYMDLLVAGNPNFLLFKNQARDLFYRIDPWSKPHGN